MRGEKDADKRVSLSDLDPEVTLRALLKVDPDAEPIVDIKAVAASTNQVAGTCGSR